MKASCDIVRDLLPLYADEVCSDGSRRLVEEHLRRCPGCEAYLRQLRWGEMESGLKEERETVLRHQAKRFRRRSEAAGVTAAGILLIPILICLIVNLSSGRPLSWFYVVAAAMVVAAALIVVPLMVPEDRLFWTVCAFCPSLLLLLAACCLYTRGDWFFTAASAVLFGLAVVCLPFLLRAKPLEAWAEGRNRALLVIGTDIVLFANMMNMITLRSKGLVYTVVLALFCVLGLVLLITGNTGKEREDR